MGERDNEFNLDAVFAGIDGILKGAGNLEPLEPIGPILNKEEHSGRYSRYFINLFISAVYTHTDPEGLALQLKREFDDYKKRKVLQLNGDGEFDVGEIVDGLSLDDVVKTAGLCIDESEREIAEFQPGSFDYKQKEAKIKRLEIIQRASDKAKDF